MSAEIIRFTLFMGVLGLLLSWEQYAPHHPPTVPRHRRWRTNLGLAAFNGVIMAILGATTAALAHKPFIPWRMDLFGQLPWLWVWRLVADVLVLDLVVYGLHRAFHRFPMLWRLHEVHHSDRDLDVTSTSRFHTGELMISALAKGLTVQLLSISPTGLVVFEVIMLVSAQFQHANVYLPRWLQQSLWCVFVPPAMHRIHHHPDRDYTNSNYGTLLSVWDRVFRTLRRVGPSDREFGLHYLPDTEELNLANLLVLPFRRRPG